VKLTHTFKITLDPSSGATLDQIARDAVKVIEAFDVHVDFVHNGTRYAVELQDPYILHVAGN